MKNLAVSGILISMCGISYGQTYTFQEISPSTYYTSPCLSDSGQYLVQSDNWYISTRNGVQTQLQTPGGKPIWANSMNNSGLVGGYTITGNNQFGEIDVATVWLNGVATQLNPGGNTSFVRSVGNDGTVYGMLYNYVNNVAIARPWTYKNGSFTYLSAGNNPNDQNGIWTGNSSGLTVGASGNPDRASIWQGTTRTVIGGQGAYNYNQAVDVNASGKVLVTSFVDYGVGKGRADIYDHGSWSAIGTYQGNPYFLASELNDLGQVIGTAYDSNGSRTNQLLWSSTSGFTNLSALSPLVDYQFGNAFALNNNGEFIVRASKFLGSGYDTKYFIATPSSVPEPATLAILGLGAMILVRKRRK